MEFKVLFTMLGLFSTFISMGTAQDVCAPLCCYNDYGICACLSSHFLSKVSLKSLTSNHISLLSSRSAKDRVRADRHWNRAKGTSCSDVPKQKNFETDI